MIAHDGDVNPAETDQRTTDASSVSGMTDATAADAGRAGGAGRAGSAAGVSDASDIREVSEVSEVVDVIVIGAGQAGLAVAGELARRGLIPGRELLVLDAEEGPGGAWRHRWDSLTIGRAHRIADLPQFPANDLDEGSPSNIAVPGYYRRYEEARGLRVLRPVHVTAVRSTELASPPLSTGGVHAAVGTAARSGRTRMSRRHDPVRRDTLLAVEARTREGRRTWLARMVVSATGTWNHPYIPHIPGKDRFAGQQLHTATYRRAEELAGQRVLVVGGGLTAVQMLLEVAPYAAAVTWATRRPPSFTTGLDDIWGAAMERAVSARTVGPFPESVVRSTGAPTLARHVDGVERGILVSKGMINLIGERAVRFSPAATGDHPDGLGADAITGGGLAVPDSWNPYPEPTWVEVDTIFWNTGFRAPLTHLEPLRLRDREGAASVDAPVDGGHRYEAGIRMEGRTGVAKDPRVLLVGYGASASTLGASRAGAEAARRIWRRLRHQE